MTRGRLIRRQALVAGGAAGGLLERLRLRSRLLLLLLLLLHQVLHLVQLRRERGTVKIAMVRARMVKTEGLSRSQPRPLPRL
jgi:hypothetical protein